MTSQWTPERIAQIISTNDAQLEKAIVRLYQRQTSTEQSAGTTIHHNTIGFSAAHASKLSYYSRWILSGHHLSGKHLATARRYTLHYTRQLAELAAERVA